MSTLHSDIDPFDKVVQAFEQAGRKTKKTTDGYMLSCPGPLHDHGDKHPSLHLSQGHSAVVMKCMAGCNTEDVLALVGLSQSDLFAKENRSTSQVLRIAAPIIPKAKNARAVIPPIETGDSCAVTLCAHVRQKSGAKCLAQYQYADKDGTVIGQVHRWDPKEFRPFTSDGKDWSLGGTIAVPYQLPRALDALQNGGTVFIVEGEKDADTINGLNLPGVSATTNSFGAGKWKTEHTSQLLEVGGTISVIGDTDAAGQEHVQKVLATFAELGQQRPRVLYPTQGKDVSEHLSNSGTLESLLEWLPEVEESEHRSKLGRIMSRSQLEELPPINPLIPGWLSTPSAAIIVGKYGLGKTAVTLAMACSVATGTPFLGLEVKQARVLYIVGEGVRGIPQRFRAWEKAWGVKVPDSEFLIMDRFARGGSLRDPETWAEITQVCLDQNVKFIVLDTLSALASDADETKDAPAIVRGLNDLAQQIDGTALIVHHPGWGSEKRARGGSQLHANLDEVLVLSSASDESEYLTVTVDKSKDGASGKTHYLRRLVVDLGQDAEGIHRSSITIEGARVNDKDIPMRSRVLVYLAACQEIGASPTEIAEELGADKGSGSFKAALSKLAQEGAVLREGSTSRARYFLPGVRDAQPSDSKATVTPSESVSETSSMFTS
jgi:hypothetical protein